MVSYKLIVLVVGSLLCVFMCIRCECLLYHTYMAFHVDVGVQYAVIYVSFGNEKYIVAVSVCVCVYLIPDPSQAFIMHMCM